MPRNDVVKAEAARLEVGEALGMIETRGLPAGEYIAAAVEGLEQGAEWNPEFRRLVERRATRFRLQDGQSATLDLQLIP